MSRALILRRQDDGETWSPDVTVSISYSQRVTISDHPVESGTVSDHVQKLPQTITAVCIVSQNSELDGLSGRAKIKAATQWLKETSEAGRLVDVVDQRMGTSLNFVIVAAPFVIDNVQRLEFPLELREVVIAKAVSVRVDVDDVVQAESTATANAKDNSSAVDGQDTGEQSTKETGVTQAEADRSLLLQLVESLGGE